MAINIQELYDKALALSANVEDNFLELGRSLRHLQDRDPDLFQQVVTKGELGRRKAYYLVEVSRTFDKAPVPKSRLRKIGWTKLQLIAKHVTPHNLDDLLELAKSQFQAARTPDAGGGRDEDRALPLHVLQFGRLRRDRKGDRAVRRRAVRARHPEQGEGAAANGPCSEPAVNGRVSALCRKHGIRRYDYERHPHHDPGDR